MIQMARPRRMATPGTPPAPRCTDRIRLVFKSDRPWAERPSARGGDRWARDIRFGADVAAHGRSRTLHAAALRLRRGDGVVVGAGGASGRARQGAGVGGGDRRHPGRRWAPWPFEIAGYANDTTRVLDIGDLRPDTRYGYALHADGDGGKVILGHNRLRSFRTPPREDEQRRFQIALFSCHMPYRVSGLFRKRTDVGDIDAWDFLGATLGRHRDNVDVVIAGGDQCYSRRGGDAGHLEAAEPRHAPGGGRAAARRAVHAQLVP